MKKIAILLIFLLTGCTTNSIDSTTYFLINKRILQLEEKVKELSIKKEVIVSNPVIKTKEINTRDFWLVLRNKSKKKITFTFKDNNWIGPKGEYYTNFPTEKEIKLLYYE